VSKNIKRVEELQVEVTKAMEGPAGYFREPGGYIIDIRNRKKSSLPAVHMA
jgi:hypothetical protein